MTAILPAFGIAAKVEVKWPSTGSVRPAAPMPRHRRLGAFGVIRALNENPLSVFAQGAYEEPVVPLPRGRVILVSDPAAVERVLVDNADNYRKSSQQQQRLQPALGEGLLAAEGEVWRRTCRIAAQLFSPKAVGLLLDDMRDAAAAMGERWRMRAAASDPLDLVAEFQRLTYEVVSRTMFSGELDEEGAGESCTKTPNPLLKDTGYAARPILPWAAVIGDRKLGAVKEGCSSRLARICQAISGSFRKPLIA